MVATDPDRAPERRRFITRRHVEDAAQAGTVLHVRRRDVVTDEAAQRATDLGVRIEREGRAPRTDASQASAPAPTRASAPTSDADLRRAVRVAVVAELGLEPAGLDAAIDRVLARRTNGPKRR
jgi:hypothetical protein